MLQFRFRLSGSLQTHTGFCTDLMYSDFFFLLHKSKENENGFSFLNEDDTRFLSKFHQSCIKLSWESVPQKSFQSCVNPLPH